MSSRIRSITIDCADPYRLATFWSQVTGYQEDPNDPNERDDPEAVLVAPDGGPALLFVPVPEGKFRELRIDWPSPLSTCTY